ncbi:MAG: hypothetical protein FWG55_01435, partial [Candidatus Bathyarchaeota archaeon]|nr:hypothetical protein [Candidatus Termiticorpusculum sp.]
MTNNFIEYLIIRSTRKTTVPVKPELTSNMIIDMLQLPPNYRQQLYTRPLYPQNNTVNQKQNNSALDNVQNDLPPQLQSIPVYPKAQKHNVNSHEPVESSKMQEVNSADDKSDPSFQGDVNGPLLHDALKAATGDQSVVEQSSKVVVRDVVGGVPVVDSVVEGRRDVSVRV